MPIGKVNKKTLTEQVEDVLAKGLQGENIGAMLASLSPYGRGIWEDMLTQFRESGDSELLQQLNVADYVEKPPTMGEFLEDPFYLGSLMVKSQDSEGLFPTWKAILTADFNYDSAIHNCVITGSLGTGKTFVMVTILLYRMLLATLLRNPHNFFGLTRGTKIVFNLLSITKAAVTETAFGDAQNFMSNCPYFLEECSYNPDNSYTNYRIPLKNSLMLTAGSRGQHLLGRNIIGVGLDEGNWRLEAEPDTKAYELFNEVRNRINNRFRKVSGYLPAISILASSAKDESSFTETIIKEIENAHDPATQKVYRNSVYKIKRHALQLGPRWFKVAYGLKNIPPMMLSGWYDEQGTPTGDEAHEAPAPGISTELVPELYHSEFKRRPLNALRDVCGISTGGVNRWFGSMVDFERCTELAEKEGVVCPVTSGLEMIPCSMEDSKNIWDYLDHRTFLTRVQSQIIPKRHPYSMRYAHIDLATQTMAGVAVCHLVGKQLIEGMVSSSNPGVPFSDYRLIVEYDFILTIVAGQIKPISLEKIQNFLLWLATKCGYNFGLVTFDQFQCLSADTLVNTDRGLLPITEIRMGDKVHGSKGLSRVTNLHRYALAPVLRITTRRKETLCGTPNHRIMAWINPKPWKKPEYQWTRLDQLKPGDIVQMVERPVKAQSRSDAPINPPELGPSRTLKKFIYPACLTPDLAEILGLLWGDGSLSVNNGLRFSLHKEHAKDLHNLLFKFFGEVPKHWDIGRNYCQISVFCRKMARWLIHNEFLKGTAKGNGATLRIPAKVLQSTQPILAAFLRGLYSADGTVDKNDGAVTLTTSHYALARQVMVILRTIFGIKTTLVPYKRLGFEKQKLIYHVRLRGSRQNFYKSIGFCYRNKMEALYHHLQRPGRTHLERIAKVEPAVEDVYDLEVEQSHSYTANGFISHNSEMSLQMLEARGFKVDKQSLDRNKDAYINWRMAVEELRLRPYRHRHMLAEAENLLDTDKKVDHPPVGCVTGDTKIRLLDGTCPPISDLVGRTGTVWVYANDGHGNIVPAKATAARITRHINTLFKITLDNGQSIRCTPEHPFMLRDGNFRKASDLSPGDSLMPFHRKLYKVKYKKGSSYYEQVWSGGNWRFTHQLVSHHLGFAASPAEVIHHQDLNSLNNSPDNLEKLTKSEHNRRHILISKIASDPAVVKKRTETFKQRYAANLEWQTRKSAAAKQAWDALPETRKAKFRSRSHRFTPGEVRERNLKLWSCRKYREAKLTQLSSYAKSKEGRAKSSETASKTNLSQRGAWTLDRLQTHRKNVYSAMLLRRSKEDERALALVAPWRSYLLGPCHAIHLTGSGASMTWQRRLSGTNWTENAEKLRGKSPEEMSRLTGLSEASLRNFLSKLGKREIISLSNHKVTSVLVETCIEEPVYDITVDTYENFCIESGISIHNSKDTCDAAAGAYNNAINSEEKVTIMSPNNPRIHATHNLEGLIQEKPPIEINLPLGYTRVKTFKV